MAMRAVHPVSFTAGSLEESLVQSGLQQKPGSQPRVARETRSRTSDAIDLHHDVSPDRWCVTLLDLRYLRAEVSRAIRKGEIVPPQDGTDDFLASQLEHGPSIYTVTEQHIKPVTEFAGKMSWALMRNPKGLDCDLFISHAWQEGIFEFLSKVLHSWPRGTRHAWCCMLANPQHLDISSMLQSPNHSPFAIALQASSNVLVVPNHHRSIYTRLWCAYEAYLAQEDGKMILIARASNWKRISRALKIMSLACLLGVVVALLVDLGEWDMAMNEVSLSVAAVAAAWSLGTENDLLRIALNLVGGAMASFLVLNWSTVGSVSADSSYHYVIFATFQRLELAALASAFCLLEVDRLSCRAAVHEAKQLGREYAGSIVHASCSRAEDDEHIRREIGDKVDAVDHAIEVLMAAGISTPSLRDIARQGVNIAEAAHSEITMPLIFLVPLNLLCAAKFFFNVFDLNKTWVLIPLLEAATVLMRVHLLLKISWSAPDERCFILLVFTKLAVIYLVLLMPAILLWESDSTTHAPVNAWFASILRSLCCLAAEFFAFLGIRGTAKLPCGLPLLRLLFARSFRGYLAAIQQTSGEMLMCPRRIPASCIESSESSEGESSEEAVQEHRG